MSSSIDYNYYYDNNNNYRKYDIVKKIVRIIMMLAYIFSGLFLLIIDFEASKSCSNNIPIYVIVTITISIFVNIILINIKKESNIKIFLLIFGLIFLGLGIYGKIIINQITCKDIVNSQLLTWLNISSIFNIVIGTLTVIMIFIIYLNNVEL